MPRFCSSRARYVSTLCFFLCASLVGLAEARSLGSKGGGASTTNQSIKWPVKPAFPSVEAPNATQPSGEKPYNVGGKSVTPQGFGGEPKPIPEVKPPEPTESIAKTRAKQNRELDGIKQKYQAQAQALDRSNPDYKQNIDDINKNYHADVEGCKAAYKADDNRGDYWRFDAQEYNLDITGSDPKNVNADGDYVGKNSEDVSRYRDELKNRGHDVKDYGYKIVDETTDLVVWRDENFDANAGCVKDPETVKEIYKSQGVDLDDPNVIDDICKNKGIDPETIKDLDLKKPEDMQKFLELDGVVDSIHEKAGIEKPNNKGDMVSGEMLEKTKSSDHDAFSTTGGRKGTGVITDPSDKFGYALDNEGKFLHAYVDDDWKTMGKSISKCHPKVNVDIAPDAQAILDQADILRNYGDPVQAGIYDLGDSPDVQKKKMDEWKQKAYEMIETDVATAEQRSKKSQDAREKLAESIDDKAKKAAENIRERNEKAKKSNDAKNKLNDDMRAKVETDMEKKGWKKPEDGFTPAKTAYDVDDTKPKKGKPIGSTSADPKAELKAKIGKAYQMYNDVDDVLGVLEFGKQIHDAIKTGHYEIIFGQQHVDKVMALEEAGIDYDDAQKMTGYYVAQSLANKLDNMGATKEEKKAALLAYAAGDHNLFKAIVNVVKEHGHEDTTGVTLDVGKEQDDHLDFFSWEQISSAGKDTIYDRLKDTLKGLLNFNVHEMTTGRGTNAVGILKTYVDEYIELAKIYYETGLAKEDYNESIDSIKDMEAKMHEMLVALGATEQEASEAMSYRKDSPKGFKQFIEELKEKNRKPPEFTPEMADYEAKVAAWEKAVLEDKVLNDDEFEKFERYYNPLTKTYDPPPSVVKTDKEPVVKEPKKKEEKKEEPYTYKFTDEKGGTIEIMEGGAGEDPEVRLIGLKGQEEDLKKEIAELEKLDSDPYVNLSNKSLKKLQGLKNELKANQKEQEIQKQKIARTYVAPKKDIKMPESISLPEKKQTPSGNVVNPAFFGEVRGRSRIDHSEEEEDPPPDGYDSWADFINSSDSCWHEEADGTEVPGRLVPQPRWGIEEVVKNIPGESGIWKKKIYFDGQPHGTWIENRMDGSLMFRSQYKNGKLMREMKYDQNGKPSLQITYKYATEDSDDLVAVASGIEYSEKDGSIVDRWTDSEGKIIIAEENLPPLPDKCVPVDQIDTYLASIENAPEAPPITDDEWTLMDMIYEEFWEEDKFIEDVEDDKEKEKPEDDKKDKPKKGKPKKGKPKAPVVAKGDKPLESETPDGKVPDKGASDSFGSLPKEFKEAAADGVHGTEFKDAAVGSPFPGSTLGSTVKELAEGAATLDSDVMSVSGSDISALIQAGLDGTDMTEFRDAKAPGSDAMSVSGSDISALIQAGLGGADMNVSDVATALDPGATSISGSDIASLIQSELKGETAQEADVSGKTGISVDDLRAVDITALVQAELSEQGASARARPDDFSFETLQQEDAEYVDAEGLKTLLKDERKDFRNIPAVTTSGRRTGTSTKPKTTKPPAKTKMTKRTRSVDPVVGRGIVKISDSHKAFTPTKADLDVAIGWWGRGWGTETPHLGGNCNDGYSGSIVWSKEKGTLMAGGLYLGESRVRWKNRHTLWAVDWKRVGIFNARRDVLVWYDEKKPRTKENIALIWLKGCR